MSEPAIFDFDAIRKAMRPSADAVEEQEPICNACEGGGWECYGLGHNDPHFRVCRECGNPNRIPCP